MKHIIYKLTNTNVQELWKYFSQQGTAMKSKKWYSTYQIFWVVR